MVEKTIEEKIGSKLEEAFKSIGIQRVQTLKSWTCAEQTEDKDAQLVLVLKVHPRAYEQYTTPIASFQIEATLIARADIDFDGKTYLDASNALLDTLHAWQKSIDLCSQDFDIEGEFSAAGFRMDGGDTGVDRDSKVWTCSENLTLYGCIEK